VRARIAASLRADVLRPDDLVGDMGPDDIACVLSTVEGPAVALLAAEKILRVVAAPLWMGEEEIYTRPAIGIAMYPDHGDEAESLVQRAKSACVAARDIAGRIAVYAGDRENPGQARFMYENRLRTAVAEDALELLFQPQYDLRLGQIMGADSLLRGRDAKLGVVPAEDAFAAAESAGVVTELVSSILNRALRNVSEFRYSAGLDLRIGVNIPGRVLLHTELPEVVERALRTWSLRPGRLVIEIGETSVLRADAAARETLERLKALGVKIAIDDFGSVASSLTQLGNLPADQLKVDRSLIATMEEGNENGTAIVSSIVDLGRRLGLEVVAEGVETQAGWRKLEALGCDAVQGYYLSHPLPAEELEAWLYASGRLSIDSDESLEVSLVI